MGIGFMIVQLWVLGIEEYLICNTLLMLTHSLSLPYLVYQD